MNGLTNIPRYYRAPKNSLGCLTVTVRSPRHFCCFVSNGNICLQLCSHFNCAFAAPRKLPCWCPAATLSRADIDGIVDCVIFICFADFETRNFPPFAKTTSGVGVLEDVGVCLCWFHKEDEK